MTADVVVLGLASVVRPTSMAAVFALLAAHRPRRLLTAYLVVGIGFTLTLGIAAVVLVHVSAPPASTTAARPWAGIVLGAAAIGIAAHRTARDRTARRAPADDDPESPDRREPVGPVPAPEPADPEPEPGTEPTGRTPRRRIQQHLAAPTTTAAGIAGVLTHLPGVFYLAVLAAVVAQNAPVPSSVLQVLVYNALWFAIPIAALVACTVRPEWALDAATRSRAALRRHRRVLTSGVLSAGGLYLVVRGAVTLLG